MQTEPLKQLPPAEPVQMLPPNGRSQAREPDALWLARVRAMLPGPALVDLLLVAAALAFAAVSLVFPFGRDQGLYFYVGREWLGGSVPYRDLMEQKTPLIYLVHAAAILAFGENLWAIRLLELLWVVVIGQMLGSLAAPAGRSPVRGTRGAATLMLAVLYWGFLDYWDTAQCEIWLAGLCVASLWALRRISRRSLAWGLAGGFAGLALLMKPTAVVLLAIVVGFHAARLFRAAAGFRSGSRSALSFLGCYAGAAAVPIMLMLTYFWVVGAIADVWDLLVRANGFYLEHERSAGSWLSHAQVAFHQWWPVSTAIIFVPLVGLVLAWRTCALEACGRYALAALLLIASVLTVVVQAKYYSYHWAVVVVPGAYALACAVDDLARWVLSRWQRPRLDWLPAPAVAVALLGLYLGSPAAERYLRDLDCALQYVAGTINRDALDRHFFLPRLGYSWWQNHLVGAWLAEHSDPQDLVAVRGFEPAIYVVAARRAPSRFFWTSWLTDPRRTYRRQEWLAEDLAALRQHPPRYLVVLRFARGGPDSQAFATELGYVRERFKTAYFLVVERPPHEEGSAEP